VADEHSALHLALLPLQIQDAAVRDVAERLYEGCAKKE